MARENASRKNADSENAARGNMPWSNADQEEREGEIGWLSKR